MKIGRSVTIVLGILVFCFVFGSSAMAASLVGTWTGSGKIAFGGSYANLTAKLVITSVSQQLIKGKITIKQAGQSNSYAVSGCVSGSTVYLTAYYTTNQKTNCLIDMTLTNSTTMTGIVRTLDSGAGYFTLTKE